MPEKKEGEGPISLCSILIAGDPSNNGERA